MQFLKEKLEKANARIAELEEGSIIETIMNSNGIAIKYANGNMICMKTITFSNTEVTSKRESIYVSDILNLGNWAESFIETPWLAQATVNGGWAAWLYQHTSYSATSAGTATLARPVSTAASSSADYRIGVTGIGKWK